MRLVGAPRLREQRGEQASPRGDRRVVHREAPDRRLEAAQLAGLAAAEVGLDREQVPRGGIARVRADRERLGGEPGRFREPAVEDREPAAMHEGMPPSFGQVAALRVALHPFDLLDRLRHPARLEEAEGARGASVMHRLLEPDRLRHDACFLDQREPLRQRRRASREEDLPAEERQGQRDRIADPPRRRDRLGAGGVAALEARREVDRLCQHGEHERTRRAVHVAHRDARLLEHGDHGRVGNRPTPGWPRRSAGRRTRAMSWSPSARARRAAWSKAWRAVG